jgi:hypothetical protein
VPVGLGFDSPWCSSGLVDHAKLIESPRHLATFLIFGLQPADVQKQ